jgi:hypothetical protein
MDSVYWELPRENRIKIRIEPEDGGKREEKEADKRGER